MVLYLSLWGTGFWLFFGLLFGAVRPGRGVLVVSPGVFPKWCPLLLVYLSSAISASLDGRWDGIFAAVHSGADGKSGLFVINLVHTFLVF